MSGGVMRAKLDQASDYISFRKRVFDLELAPLPLSLKLNSIDATFETRDTNNILVPQVLSTT